MLEVKKYVRYIEEKICAKEEHGEEILKDESKREVCRKNGR